MLPIVTGAETPILITPSARVKDPLFSDIQALLPQMVESMRSADGIGLAAPQIGVALRLAVIELDGLIRFFINPKIAKHSGNKIISEEGCLSLPGDFFPIERFERVTVRYTDEHDTPQTLSASGLLAIAIQHEIDHLDGILISNRYNNQKHTQPYAL